MSVNHHPISQANKREQQTQQRWIQQVAGNPRWEDLQTKLRKNDNVHFKFSSSNGTAKENTVNHRYVKDNGVNYYGSDRYPFSTNCYPKRNMRI